MEQNKSKGAVIKGLAFPIGYTAYMNVVQIGLIMLILALCLLRALLALIAVPEIGMEGYMEHYMLDYTDLLNNNTWFLSALTTIIGLVVLWFVFNRKNRNFLEYFRFTPAPAKALIAAALLGLSAFFITNAVMTVIQSALFALLDWAFAVLEEYSDVDITPIVEYFDALIESMSQMYDGMGMFTVAAIIGAPLIEELVFRAGPLVNLTKKMPTFWAVVLTSALFALAHGNPLQMIYTFGLGMICAYLFIKSDSIYPSIVCHFVFNGANLIALLMQALFRTDFWSDSPYYAEICAKLDTWSAVTYWVYLVGTFLIAIPMLAVGLIMLIKLRRPAAAPEQLPVELKQVEEVIEVTTAEAAEEVFAEAAKEIEPIQEAIAQEPQNEAEQDSEDMA